MRGKIKLVLVHTDKECGCKTFRQSLGGVEIGGLLLDECPKHKAETQALHERAMADYRAARQVISSSNEAGTGSVRSPGPDGVAGGVSADA